MTFVIAYDVATSYSESQLEYRLVADDSAVPRIFATSERAWFGEVVDGPEVGPPACEPGYALLVDRGDRGRPEERPRPEHIAIAELFEAKTLLAERARAQGAAVVAMRVLRRKPAAEPAWPPEARALNDEVLAHPDDDGPRLVLADLLEAKRGALVVAQCALARPGLTPAESGARRRTHRDLLAKHGKAWSRLDGLAPRCAFRRGFVESIELDYLTFARDGERILDAAPHLRSVSLSYVGGPLDAIFQHPAARCLTGLYVRLRGPAPITGESFRALRAFGVPWARGEVSRLAAAVENLEVLWLDGHDLGPSDLARFVERSPGLRALNVAGHRSVVAAVPSTIRELWVACETMQALSAAAFAPTLEKLSLAGIPITPDHLGAFPMLRALELTGRDDVDRTLAHAHLPALRELRLPHTSGPDDLRAIARAFGPQLDLLDLRGNRHASACLDELRAVVAGDVCIGAYPPGALMPASYLPDEPLWDVGTVDLMR